MAVRQIRWISAQFPALAVAFATLDTRNSAKILFLPPVQPRQMLLQAAARPLLTWSDPLAELFGFVALFLAAGAVGFRYAALRGLRDDAAPDAPDLVANMSRRAAWWGFTGALMHSLALWAKLPASAARAHVDLLTLVTTDHATMLSVGLAAVAIVALAAAASGVRGGWPVGAAAVVLGALPQLLLGQWSRLVNPIHALAAGLWLGTLFVMVVAGIAPVLRDERLRASRGAVVAEMVHAFSPVALTMGGIVVVFGVITAWKHLNPLSSVYTTPYGWALLAKLSAVAVVYGLGGWNWRRQRPTLGSPESADSIYRSSRAELVAAGVVLLCTAVLLSLPSPRRAKPPGAPGSRPAAARAAAPAPAP